MGLLDELKVLTENQSNCKEHELLESLPKDEFEIAMHIMTSPDGNINGLSRILTKNGYQISPRTLLKHRNRHNPDLEGCKCP
jgi:hypothetical protein